MRGLPCDRTVEGRWATCGSRKDLEVGHDQANCVRSDTVILVTR